MELAYKKENIFLHKFMPCLLFFMIAVMSLIGSFVYADNETIDYVFSDGNTYSVPIFPLDNNENFALSIWDNGSKLTVWTYNKNYTLKFDSANTYVYLYDDQNNIVSENLNNFSYYDFPDSLVLSKSGTGGYIYPSTSPFYSNVNLYNVNNDLVFQAPPQQVEAQGIIAEKTQGVEMDKTLQEIVGILPVILLTIVGILAVRKGIQFLMAKMKRA